MTPRQLALRYGTADFPLTLFRAEMDTDNLPEDILKGIEEAALANQTDVVFIDNITTTSRPSDNPLTKALTPAV